MRGRLWRTLLLCGMTPLFALVGYVLLSQQDVLAQKANENLLAHASQQAVAVKRVLDNAAGDARVLALNPVLKSPSASQAEKSRQLREAQSFYDLFEDITLVNPKGNVIDSTSYLYYGTWSTKDWFNQALQGQPAMSDARLIPAPTRLVVEFAVPVFNDGEVVAVIAGQMNMERIWEIVDRVAIGKTGFLVAFNKGGDIISHPDKDRILSNVPQARANGGLATGRPVALHEVSPRGDVVVQMAPVGALGWQVAAMQDASEAYALVTDTVQKITMALILALVATVAAAFLFSKSLSQRVSTVAAGMHRVAAGDLDLRLPPSDIREIDDLSTSFNLMAANLQRSSDQLAHAAATDGLTGLYNHRSLQEILTREVQRSNRSSRPLAVLMMDIDGFKAFNDTYGHQAGDVVLQRTAALLTKASRATDVVGRYGGDEFMAILPDTGREGALAVANRIIEFVEAERIHVAQGRDVPIALTIGLAVCPDDTTNKQELVAYADVSMYEAKQVPGSAVALHGHRPGDLIAYQDTPLGVLDSLVRAIDHKDRYTRRHSLQDADLAVKLGTALGLSEGTLRALRIAGLLHDVGKIGVPDHILKKPGPLTEEERTIMQEHVVIGKLIIHGVPNLLDVADAIAAHHERWEGGGYPQGLKGEKIPVLGRILAIADAYSAMVLDRPYRKALDREQAIAELRRGTGTQFDPALVEPFIRIIESDQGSVEPPTSPPPGNGAEEPAPTTRELD